MAVSEDLFFAPAAIEQGRDICREVFEQHGEVTMSQLREAWGISRKFAVPLCEYFDEAEITIRQGDVRVPGPKLAIPHWDERSGRPTGSVARTRNREHSTHQELTERLCLRSPN